MRMRYMAICDLSRSTTFSPHYVINGTIFGGKSYWTQNVCFDFLYNSRVKNPTRMGFLNLEDVTDSLSRNVGKELPLLAE
jgi:hypothetical protein